MRGLGWCGLGFPHFSFRPMSNITIECGCGDPNCPAKVVIEPIVSKNNLKRLMVHDHQGRACSVVLSVAQQDAIASGLLDQE